MTKAITALFNTREELDPVLEKLDRAGFATDDVSLVVSEETRGHHFGIVEDDKAEEGAVAGAAIGGLAGALYMGLASAGTFFIPGLNVFVSGALIGSLAGLGAGLTMGGLLGGLFGAVIPEHEVKLFEEKIREGGILVAVNVVDDKQEALVKRIFKDANAQNVKAAA